MEQGNLVSIDQLDRNRPARVASVDWDTLSTQEARRLREFGLDDGIEVELLHHAGIGGGPVAVRLGRMTIALRRHIAHAIHVNPDAQPA